jgi:hypothetical protein
LDFRGSDGEVLEAAGFVTMTISEFVHVAGEVAFRRQEELQVTPVGSNTTIPVSVLTVGANEVRAFAGVGGPYWVDRDDSGDFDDTIDTPAAEGALGVALKDVSFGLALMKPVVDPGQPASTITYIGLKARGSAEFVGIEALEVATENMLIEVNTARDSAALDTDPPVDVIDFTQLLPGGRLNVRTGPPPSLGAAAPFESLDFAGPALRVSGFVRLSISDFVHVSGSFSVEPGQETTVTLDDPDDGGPQQPQTRTVTLLKVGAQDAHLFVGVGGPYWQDNNQDGDVDDDGDIAPDGAMGVIIEDAAFALALLKPVAVNNQPSEESFYALKASGSVAFVGIDAFDIRADKMDIEVNGARGPPGSVPPAVDFAASFTNPDNTEGLRVPTGPDADDFILLDYSGPLLRIRGAATVTIDQFIHVSGLFSIEPGQELDVTLTDNTTRRVTALKVGAADVHAFVGLGGPYWVDSDSDGDIDDAPTTTDATGLALADVSFGLVFMRPGVQAGQTPSAERYYALKTRGSAELIGVENVSFLADDITVGDKVVLPEGTYLEWTGQFEHAVATGRTLLVVIPIVIASIFLFLYLTYHDWADACLMLLAVPGTVAGGVLFQWLFGFKFSIAVGVGYIACFGMAAATGMIMPVYLREAVEKAGGLEKLSLAQLRQAVMDGAVHRLRPKLLTEGTMILGLAPMLWASGVGAEVIRPMAAPVLGGILIADEVIDLLLPVLFYHVRRRRRLALEIPPVPADQ